MKKNIKKLFFLVFSFVSIIPAIVSAQDYTGPSSVSDIKAIITQLVTWMYEAFYIIAVGFILWAAFNYLQGGTNPEKIKAAKSQLKYAVIAIAIALIASGVSVILNSVLSIK